MTMPQLRVRSEFSFKKAYGSPSRIAERLAAINCSSAGIVDSGGTWGHVKFEKAMLTAGLQPMFGAEFNVHANDGLEERRKFKTDWPVAWCLADDLSAFYEFSSSTPTDPVQWADATGIIRFSGSALKDPACFDYVDINPASILRCKQNIELAARTCRPLVLTCDNNYPSHADAARYLSVVDVKKTTMQHIPDAEEMRQAFWFLDDRLYHYAMMGTLEVAERLQGKRLPKSALITAQGNITDNVREGKAYRLAAKHIKEWTQVYEDRLQLELGLIADKGFESYFLVVADLVLWAKQHMLVGPARGSSAGSLVCYLLRITEVDPIVHHLLFERFIDINRNDLPDIDIDFSDTHRDECFVYLAQKYGQENVARLGNVNTLKPRSVMAEVGKRLGIPANATFAVRNVLIEYSSGDSRYGKGLEDTLLNTRPGQDFVAKYPESELMGEVEGHVTHTGIHAAGVLVSNTPVTHYCTVKDGIAQIDKIDAEYLNMLKIDALGLRTLGVIEDTGCVSNELLYGLTLDDPEVLKILDEHKFSGVFQFEGGAQRRVSMQVPMTDFTKIDHVTALARPGPLGGGAANTYINRNMNREETTFRHPSMVEYLGDTFGVVLYQEQVMRIVREIGKFTWEETSVIRKAMSGRKGKEFFDRRGEIFAEGAESQGIDQDTAKLIWNEICNFGAWGMNRCISGTTRVRLAHANQVLGPEPTIKKLYDFYKVNPSDWVRQRKLMPVLLCYDGHKATPCAAIDIHHTGTKHCLKLEFSGGKVVECTADHKFIINGEWMRCGDAVIGDEFSVVSRKRQIKNHAKHKGKGWRKGRPGAGMYDMDIGHASAANAFKREMRGSGCQDCGAINARLEVHHNDFLHGTERPNDMSWLCSSCHKLRHKAAGNWGKPFDKGWTDDEPATLLAITDCGQHETFDIEMPAPHHNYVLANGIVTHNSHTVSYAIISYWCCYMKRYHPIEYAAACLRNAKDDVQTVEILRELSAEGVGFIPFDPVLSQRNWSAQDGKLVGGFTNLAGIGPAKAEAYVQKRETTGLTAADIDKLRSYPVKNSELRPAHAMWGDYYQNPHKYNIAGKVREFADLEDWERCVVVCKLVSKERRDENETVRRQRRGGDLRTGQTQFLDAFVVDDSVSKPVVLRIKPDMWHTHGEKMADRAIDGQDWFLVRGKWLYNFSMLTVQKIKCLTQPDMFD